MTASAFLTVAEALKAWPTPPPRAPSPDAVSAAPRCRSPAQSNTDERGFTRPGRSGATCPQVRERGARCAPAPPCAGISTVAITRSLARRKLQRHDGGKPSRGSCVAMAAYVGAWCRRWGTRGSGNSTSSLITCRRRPFPGGGSWSGIRRVHRPRAEAGNANCPEYGVVGHSHREPPNRQREERRGDGARPPAVTNQRYIDLVVPTTSLALDQERAAFAHLRSAEPDHACIPIGSPTTPVKTEPGNARDSLSGTRWLPAPGVHVA